MHTTVLGVDVGIDTTKLTPLVNLVQRLCGVLVPSNKAIVGSGLYQIESGIIASWFKNCGEKNATELFPVRWSEVPEGPVRPCLVKGRPRVVLSGRSTATNDITRVRTI